MTQLCEKFYFACRSTLYWHINIVNYKNIDDENRAVFAFYTNKKSIFIVISCILGAMLCVIYVWHAPFYYTKQ